jgi:hypothetical protein
MKSFVGIALALVLITGRPTLTRSEDWPNEGAILADYVEALRKMETFYAHIYARGSLTKIFHKPEGEIRQDVEIEFWCDGVNHLTREVSKDADETLRERLQGSNRDYRFVIVRDTLDRSFVIDDFIPASTSVSESVAEYPAPWKPDTTFATGFPAAAYSVFDMAMSRIIASPSFKLRRAVREGNDNLVRFEFSFRPDRDYPVVQASVLLQPSLGWAVRSYEGGFGTDGKVKRSGTVDYGHSIGGIPIPKLVTRDHPSYHYEFVFESLESTRPGAELASRFRLSGYGLPEVGEAAVEEGWGRWPSWLIATGVALLLVAAGMAYVHHRSR